MRGLRTLTVGAALCLCVWLAAAEATARPGGGDSYSGGGSSDSGSSYSGGSSSSSSSDSGSSYSSGSGGGSMHGDPLGTLLAFIGGVVVIIIASILQGHSDTSGSQTEYVHSSGSSSTDRSSAPEGPPADEALAVLREADESFSRVIFEDFVYALYAQAHRARRDPNALAALVPYLKPPVRIALSERPGIVEAVVVGSLQLRRATRVGDGVRVRVAVDSNLHVELPESRATQYVQETWTLRRPAAARTKPIVGVRKLGCPACGAPFKPAGDGRCEACGQVVADGRFDWQVADIEVDREDHREHTLTGTSEEVGTDADTTFQPLVGRLWDALVESDPALTRETFEARLRLIFDTLQSAWAAQDLASVRPFVSERLYAYLQYWIDAYKEQGLRNQVADARLERFVTVRVDRDRHYDAVVVRFWATGCDFTENVESGLVVGGSRTKERRYSEYWTMVRSAKVRGTPRADKTCPSCGAALDVNMSGECAHCGTHVTSGEFDWVLSKIEQDEAYKG